MWRELPSRSKGLIIIFDKLPYPAAYGSRQCIEGEENWNNHGHTPPDNLWCIAILQCAQQALYIVLYHPVGGSLLIVGILAQHGLNALQAAVIGRDKRNEFRLFGIKICSFVEQYKVLSTDEDSEEIRDDIYLHELITEPPEFN